MILDACEDLSSGADIKMDPVEVPQSPHNRDRKLQGDAFRVIFIMMHVINKVSNNFIKTY